MLPQQSNVAEQIDNFIFYFQQLQHSMKPSLLDQTVQILLQKKNKPFHFSNQTSSQNFPFYPQLEVKSITSNMDPTKQQLLPNQRNNSFNERIIYKVRQLAVLNQLTLKKKKHSGKILSLTQKREFWGNDKKGRDWVNEQERRNKYCIIYKPGEVKKIDHQQKIVYLQPSLQEKKLQQMRITGLPFRDFDFPPNQNSLSGPYGKISDWEPIKWKRISKMYPNVELFQGRVEPQDIEQGFLGDCYFLAGLSALAERPDRIYKLFLLKKKNQLNYFSLRILYRGKWRTIDIDEYIPFVYNQPAFGKTKENQLWVILLEKAWAKMYGCYKQIQGGFPDETLHDLTGAPIKNIHLKSEKFNKKEAWQYLLQASQLDYSMVASSKPGKDTEKSIKGIVQGHAYTILGATEMQFANKLIQIVKLRNPWGKTEFKGNWSDYDSNWNYVSQYQKKRVEFEPDVEDGTFFMDFDDLINQFQTITIAQINDDASYVYRSMRDPKCKGVYFRIQILEQGKYSLQVDKTPERSFTGETQMKYKYPKATLDFGKIEESRTILLCEGFSSKKRTLFKDLSLVPGTYIAKVQIDFNPKFQRDFDVNLAVYSEYACGIHLATKQEVIDFTGDSSIQWQVKEEDKIKKLSQHFGKCEKMKQEVESFIKQLKANPKVQPDINEEMVGIREQTNSNQSYLIKYTDLQKQKKTPKKQAITPPKEIKEKKTNYQQTKNSTHKQRKSVKFSQQKNQDKKVSPFQQEKQINNEQKKTIVSLKGKKKTIQTQTKTKEVQIISENPSGSTVIKKQKKQNKKIVQQKKGVKGKKVTESQKITELIENQINGETVKLVEVFNEKIQTKEQGQNEQIIRRVEERKGRREICEEEDDKKREFVQEFSISSMENETILDIQNEDQQKLTEKEKQRRLIEMEKKIYGTPSNKYTLYLEIEDSQIDS